VLSAITAVAIWFGPETYTDDITVDNSVSEPAAAPIVARA
jgi:hypothetical protein